MNKNNGTVSWTYTSAHLVEAPIASDGQVAVPLLGSWTHKGHVEQTQTIISMPRPVITDSKKESFATF